MKQGSQGPRMATYLNDKRISALPSELSFYMNLMAKSLIICVYVRLRT
jgi:hypothetical protein